MRQVKPPQYLFRFRAVEVPTADLVIAGEHVHGHHTDGEGHCTHDNLPGVRGHQEAVHTEETRQHGGAELGTDINRVPLTRCAERATGQVKYNDEV